MLNDLVIPAIKGKPYFPTVEFRTNGSLNITGSSYMENAIEFYDTLLDWLDEFMETEQDIHINIFLEYFNTSSSKSLNNLFIMLDEYYADGVNVKANWYYKEGDIDSLAEGVEFKEEIAFPFEIIIQQSENVSQMVA